MLVLRDTDARVAVAAAAVCIAEARCSGGGGGGKGCDAAWPSPLFATSTITGVRAVTEASSWQLDGCSDGGGT